ncbi:hypothetical protein ACIBO5_40835 [Nonomuraea angiospora]
MTRGKTLITMPIMSGVPRPAAPVEIMRVTSASLSALVTFSA